MPTSVDLTLLQETVEIPMTSPRNSVLVVSVPTSSSQREQSYLDLSEITVDIAGVSRCWDGKNLDSPDHKASRTRI